MIIGQWNRLNASPGSEYKIILGVLKSLKRLINLVILKNLRLIFYGFSKTFFPISPGFRSLYEDDIMECS